ncbi:hypothetical protein AAF712_000711 [Marasmius tenuissimus]|uniref:Uncharacterized protein n=1 Tax=Marasmius tenuissimus TaxID=585030 RepID=A0ABR3AEC9_9AGAR
MSNGNTTAAVAPDGKSSVWVFASRIGESIRHERNCRICDEYTRHILEADLNSDTSLAAAREALQRHVSRELGECRQEIARLRKALEDYHTADPSPFNKTHAPLKSNLSLNEPAQSAVPPKLSARTPVSSTSSAVNNNSAKESAPPTLLPQPRVSTTTGGSSSDATSSLSSSAAQPTAGPSIPINLAANIVPIIKEEPDDLAFVGPLQYPTTLPPTKTQARSDSINPSIQLNLPCPTPAQQVVPTNVFDNAGPKVSIPPLTNRPQPSASVTAQGHGPGQMVAADSGGGPVKTQRPSRIQNNKKQCAGNALQMIPENQPAARNSPPPVLASRITDSQTNFGLDLPQPSATKPAPAPPTGPRALSRIYSPASPPTRSPSPPRYQATIATDPLPQRDTGAEGLPMMGPGDIARVHALSTPSTGVAHRNGFAREGRGEEVFLEFPGHALDAYSDHP